MLFGDRTPAHIVHQNQLDYGTMLSLALAKQLRISHVHVQTASLTLLRDYTQLATDVGLHVAFTRNTRYSDDSWGTVSRSDTYRGTHLHYSYEQLLVAAVNAEIRKSCGGSFTSHVNVDTVLEGSGCCAGSRLDGRFCFLQMHDGYREEGLR